MISSVPLSQLAMKLHARTGQLKNSFFVDQSLYSGTRVTRIVTNHKSQSNSWEIVKIRCLESKTAGLLSKARPL
jgi:hypothetical protein